MKCLKQLGLAVLLPIILGSCEEKVPEERSTLLEAITVKGRCMENHVRKWGEYEGVIVRWKNDETGTILTYGDVTSTIDLGKRVIAEVEHPTGYLTPFMVEFEEITVDTNLQSWTLHGISNHGENEQGYESTCRLVVVSRSDRLPDI